MGGLTTSGRYGKRFIAARARQGLMAKFISEADPEGRLDPIEREERARALLRAHMIRLSLMAKRARARRRIHESEP